MLTGTFGLADFRTGQAEVVAAAESGSDVLYVAPTGSGKSVAYWIPGLVRGGLSIVVSPLIALMVDQVTRLTRLGVAAACLHGQMDVTERRDALARAAAGELRFFYLAPERIGSPGMLDALAQLAVDRVVVDEAHCISSWGHEFRPDYRRLGAALAACGHPPVGAFTATATPRVRRDIIDSLRLRDPVERVTGFVRPNLTLSVVPCRGMAEKREQLRDRLPGPDQRTLVYCGTRAAAEEVTDLLSASGVAAAAYHGALGGDQRQAVYDAFADRRLQVVVATSAFGMGVDFPDIRCIIHHSFPGSLEEYYQQVGRAGRDGAASACTLLYSDADRQLHAFFIEQAYPERDSVRLVYRELTRAGHGRIDDWSSRLPAVSPATVRASLALLERAGALTPDGGLERLTGPPVDFDAEAQLKQQAYARVRQVIEYAGSRDCRHARIADYFGEQGVARRCDACDNCRRPAGAPTALIDPVQVAAALACVARFDGHLGAARLALILHGRSDAWSAAKPWVAQLASFGALSDWEVDRIRDLLNELVARDLVARGDGEHPTLKLSEAGRAVLSGRAAPAVALEQRPDRLTRGARRGAPEVPAGGPLSGEARSRFQALRSWRAEAARRGGVPAYLVFHDRTLSEIALRAPATLIDLETVPGVGPDKLARYGAAVVALLHDHL